MNRAFFGTGQEKRDLEASDRTRAKSETDAFLFSQSLFPAPVVPADPDGKNKTKGKSLPEVIIESKPSDAELIEESKSREIKSPSADQWEATGLYDESVKIQIIERRYVREIHRKMKYQLRSEFNPDAEKEVIVTANGVGTLLPGMNYTTDFVASVVADKYISHLPLERQLRQMESLGLTGMQNSTLSRMCRLSAIHLESLAIKILHEIQGKGEIAIHLDETPWKIQNKDEKDGYMWVVSNRVGSYYFFAPTRSAAVLKERIPNYTGPAVTDGFKSYDSILSELKIPHAYCWAHARREFLPLEDHDPTIKPILDLIDEIFRIEREARDFSELKSLRIEKSKPTAEKLRDLLLNELPRARESSHKKKAIQYVLTRWDGFTLFLNDIRIPLSNNEAERTIRHAVMGRKNYYGSGNHTGAETAATLFTIIESCKKNEIDPRSFIIMTLQKSARSEILETPLEYAKKRSASNEAH